MPAAADKGASWFTLPYRWDMDEALIGLPEGAKLLFIKIVEFCHMTQNGGTLSMTQVVSLSKEFTRGRQCVDRLLASGALIANSSLTAREQFPDSSLAAREQFSSSSLTAREQSVSIANAARWRFSNNQPKPISAAQPANAPTKSAEKPPRGGARVKREREREREEERTPSGSVRSSSARAAPRVAGGAPQPALQDQESAGVDGGGRLSRDEAIAFARSEIARGRAKNPAATGIDTKFSKYDPDRPIIPITSAFGMNGDTE